MGKEHERSRAQGTDVPRRKTGDVIGWPALRRGAGSPRDLESRLGDLVLADVVSAVRWAWVSFCSKHPDPAIDSCTACRAGHWACVVHNLFDCEGCSR